MRLNSAFKGRDSDKIQLRWNRSTSHHLKLAKSLLRQHPKLELKIATSKRMIMTVQKTFSKSLSDQRFTKTTVN